VKVVDGGRGVWFGPPGVRWLDESLLLIPTFAAAGGLKPPAIEDWIQRL